MRKEFAVHMLNQEGKDKARKLALVFEVALAEVEDVTGTANNGRELALCRTHMELAGFYAKKAMALNPVNQDQEFEPLPAKE